MASITTPSSASCLQLLAASDEVGADVALRGVLAAAAEQDVDVVGDRVADADRNDPHVEAAPLQSLAQDQDIAGVAVDVHLLRVQVDEGDHAATPVRVRVACSDHIAVYVLNTATSPPGATLSTAARRATSRSGRTASTATSS